MADLREKMIKCWERDYSDELVCEAVGIDLEVLREMLESDGKLARERTRAMSHLRMKAKDNIAQWVEDGSMRGTQYFADRRMKDEYSTRQNVEITAEEIITPIEERLAEAKTKMDELLKDE